MFGDNPALAGVTNGDIVRDTFGGIAHAAIGYGAGKLIQQSGDRPSWNFNNVAMDAFGNALGNSFVASRVKAEEDRLKLVQGNAMLTQDASNAANAALDAQFDVDQGKRNAAIENDMNQLRQQEALSKVIDLNKVQDADNAKRADQTLARVEAVNAQSEALQAQANGMQQHFDARVEYGQQVAADAMQRGINRGAYAASKNYQSQDLMAGVDVEGYINFRQGQINDFNNFKANLSGPGSFAFHTGANLFNGLVNGGRALGDATALLGIQGGYAFSSAWSNVGDTLSYVANNPVDALIVNPATAAYNRYSSIYSTDGFGAAAGTLTGDLLSGVPFAAVGFAKPLNLPKADLAPLNRRMFAEDALVELGFSKGRAANYIDGIDFNHSVELVELPIGVPFAQFQPMGRPLGNFLTDIGTDINTLGIRPTGKQLTPYAPMQTIPALRSITSDIEVNWDGLPTYQAKGGGVQYIIPDKYKSMFEVLYYGD